MGGKAVEPPPGVCTSARDALFRPHRLTAVCGRHFGRSSEHALITALLVLVSQSIKNEMKKRRRRGHVGNGRGRVHSTDHTLYGRSGLVHSCGCGRVSCYLASTLKTGTLAAAANTEEGIPIHEPRQVPVGGPSHALSPSWSVMLPIALFAHCSSRSHPPAPPHAQHVASATAEQRILILAARQRSEERPPPTEHRADPTVGAREAHC